MKIGIVGLPNVGKSTIFNAITKAGAEVANYPFCTIDPNVGIVEVPDERLDILTKMYNPKKKVPAAVEFFDIAGLVKGASKGEGLGNKFLSHIRETEAIMHVVRCFEDKNIAHVTGKIDPVSDIETITTELLLADMESVTKKIQKLERDLKAGDKKTVLDLNTAKKILKQLEAGMPARTIVLEEAEKEFIKESFLLTSKPILYACNMSDDEIQSMKNEYTEKVAQIAARDHSEIVPICAKIEAELSELADEEKKAFLLELGLKEPGLNRLIRASYSLLGLISFYTVGEDECRAWTIKKGFLAPQAAGTIHSDFERGFIRAEVMHYPDLERLKSEKTLKEAGLLRSEGKDYVVKDGDIINFRFNV